MIFWTCSKWPVIPAKTRSCFSETTWTEECSRQRCEESLFCFFCFALLCFCFVSFDSWIIGSGCSVFGSVEDQFPAQSVSVARKSRMQTPHFALQLYGRSCSQVREETPNKEMLWFSWWCVQIRFGGLLFVYGALWCAASGRIFGERHWQIFVGARRNQSRFFVQCSILFLVLTRNRFVRAAGSFSDQRDRPLCGASRRRWEEDKEKTKRKWTIDCNFFFSGLLCDLLWSDPIDETTGEVRCCAPCVFCGG